MSKEKHNRRTNPSRNRRKRSGGATRQTEIKREDSQERQSVLMPGLTNRSLQRILTEGVGSARPGMEAVLLDRLRRVSATASAHAVAGLTGSVLRQAAEEGEAEPASERRSPPQGKITIRSPRVEYYDVTGATLEEVLDQLDPDEWGHCAANYRYTYSATGGRTTRVNVTLTLTIRLPRWRGAGWRAASRPAREEWNRMVAALRAHEDHHAEIARTWAPIFRERLFDIDEGDVELEGSNVEAEAQAEQDQYDADSAHGQNEGVSLDTSIE